MAELLLDSDIRIWVFLPIVVITFLVGIIRHYVTILLSSEKKIEQQQIADRYIHTIMTTFFLVNAGEMFENPVINFRIVILYS